jgi:hypothetical protein
MHNKEEGEEKEEETGEEIIRWERSETRPQLQGERDRLQACTGFEVVCEGFSGEVFVGTCKGGRTGGVCHGSILEIDPVLLFGYSSFASLKD